MSTEERSSAAGTAVAQLTGQPFTRQLCPFLSSLIPNAHCHKKGGVCSLQKIDLGPDGSGIPVQDQKIVATCPSRFIENVEPGKILFSWVAEKMLDISDPVIVKETPFLRSITSSGLPVVVNDDMEQEAKEELKKAGRIDWILADPSTTATKLAWCAVETQALYFSGSKMLPEFAAYLTAPSNFLFPTKSRRPDYRSSGPKRLWPQLDVKVPVLRAWGYKVAVVIDSYFHANMNTLVDPFPRAKSDRERRDVSEVVWFVVDFDESRRLKINQVLYTTLEGSRTALNATEPLSQDDFMRDLKQVIERSPKNKVFRVSKSIARE